MDHVLDNPAWSALTSGNKHLANGSGQALYFDKEVSPFAALEENTPANFQHLYQLIGHNDPVIFISPEEIAIPPPWTVLQSVHGLQMIYNNAIGLDDVKCEMAPLTTQHVPQMLELTKLTNPGPFASRTIDFGHYVGFFEGGKLVAMAGQRLHAFQYCEISAVCTHPDHTGKGYARQLLQYHVNRILKENSVPFLHVRNDNARAIKIYEDLGFSVRKDIWFYVLKKTI